jgi:SAM-dependent methyltransferase
MGRAYNEWLYRVQRRVFLRLVRRLKLASAGARVPDVGSGTGFCVALWRRLGAAVVGLDISPHAVERLRDAHPGCAFLELDVGAPGSEVAMEAQGPFDVVSAFAVFYHIVDDQRFARAIGAVAGTLRLGGLFLVSDNFRRGNRAATMHQVNRPLDCWMETLRANRLVPLWRTPQHVLMNAPVDHGGALAWSFWRLLARLAARSERTGASIGAALYPLEVLLTTVLKESWTTEVMVCRRER